MASTLLFFVSAGLITAYVVLVYNMSKYFKEQMKNEICKLTVLFATFVMAYFLRLFYQIGLGHTFYKEIISDMVCRWWFINILPLIWDITSILSILILHWMSFRKPAETKNMLKAGHYKD